MDTFAAESAVELSRYLWFEAELRGSALLRLHDSHYEGEIPSRFDVVPQNIVFSAWHRGNRRCCLLRRPSIHERTSRGLQRGRRTKRLISSRCISSRDARGARRTRPAPAAAGSCYEPSIQAVQRQFGAMSNTSCITARACPSSSTISAKRWPGLDCGCKMILSILSLSAKYWNYPLRTLART